MDAGPRIESYEWERGREAMLRFGPDNGATVVVALPLFEEANRTRGFVVTILRCLGQLGVGSVLPDLPGQGESLLSSAAVSLLDLQHAYAAALTQSGAAVRGFGIGVRTGALLDGLGLLAGRWHLSPQTGAELLRELRRLRTAERTERLAAESWWCEGDPTEGNVDSPVRIAGSLISTDLLTALAVTEPFNEPDAPRRIVRLASDPRPADLHLERSPPWRSAEPVNDPVLAEMLAIDIADWVRICEGC